MALLDSCLCCSLVRGAIFTSIYATITYIAALSLQLYWIIESEAALPAPAYIQAAAYLVTVVMSMLLFVGVLIKRCQLLLGWLFVMILFWLPECSLVFLMVFHHWGSTSTNGTVEISMWVCRAAINIICIICVHSLYSSWRDEKTVMKRLQHLNMTSVLTDHQNKKHFKEENSHNLHDRRTKNKSTLMTSPPYYGYRNHGYISTNEFLPEVSNELDNKNNRGVSRSLSSVSHLHYHNNNNNMNNFKDDMIGNDLERCGLFISHDDVRRLERIHAVHQAIERNQRERSQFDPLVLSSAVHSQGSQDDLTFCMPQKAQKYCNFHRPRPKSIAIPNNRYISRQLSFIQPESHQCPVHPDFSTQSLDRSKYIRVGRDKRSSSSENLNVKISSNDISLEKLNHKPFDYLNRPGSRQASERGSELERIKDIAL